MNVRPTNLSRAYKGEKLETIPCWLMRQAGRYLPEYRKLRSDFPSFIDFCMTPEAASEATLQPLKRFDLDGAIIFSDILIIPYALGQEVSFVKNHGPQLGALSIDNKSVPDQNIFNNVFEAIRLTRAKLPEDKALIGFAGAPWTVLCYMIDGQSSKTFSQTLLKAIQNPDEFQIILDKVVESTTAYLKGQIKAGADIIKLFDSWSGLVPYELQERCIYQPTAKIVESIKSSYPNIPIVGFPKGMGANISVYGQKTGVDCVAVDSSISLPQARSALQTNISLQGNMDQHALIAGGDFMEHAARRNIGTQNVFNLGHGIMPQTPPEHVESLIDIVKGKIND